VSARAIQETLSREEAGDWELATTVPVTQLGFTSAVWLLFRRPV
jgi:hypothetical protein